MKKINLPVIEITSSYERCCVQLVAAEIITHSREKIQAAINKVHQLGGGCVHIPAGHFIIDYCIDLKSNVHLEGCGEGVTILKLKDNIILSALEHNRSKGAIIRCKGCQNSKISNLTINGNRDRNKSFAAFSPEYMNGSFQNGITVMHHFEEDSSKPGYNPDIFVYAIESNYSKNVHINNCTISNCIADGIGLVGSKNCLVRNCFCYNNSAYNSEGQVIFSSFGINLSEHTQNCLIESCKVNANHHGGIEMGSLTSISHIIRHCHVDSITVNLFSPSSIGLYHIIENCLIDDTVEERSGSLITLYHGSHIVVRNCTINIRSDNGIFGFSRNTDTEQVFSLRHKDNSTGLQILNNQIYLLPSKLKPFKPYAAINVANLNDFIISGNKIFGTFTDSAIRMICCANGIVSNNCLVGIEEFWEYSGILTEYIGINLYGCQEVVVQSNIIRGYQFGITEGSFNEILSDSNLIMSNNLRNNLKPHLLNGLHTSVGVNL
jgi:hypothetical protein